MVFPHLELIKKRASAPQLMPFPMQVLHVWVENRLIVLVHEVIKDKHAVVLQKLSDYKKLATLSQMNYLPNAATKLARAFCLRSNL